MPKATSLYIEQKREKQGTPRSKTDHAFQQQNLPPWEQLDAGLAFFLNFHATIQERQTSLVESTSMK